jgi:hypothetical protein
MEDEELPNRRGPWHCHQCRIKFDRMQVRDLTLDEDLLKYLSHDELPRDHIKCARILKASRFMKLDD